MSELSTCTINSKTYEELIIPDLKLKRNHSLKNTKRITKVENNMVSSSQKLGSPEKKTFKSIHRVFSEKYDPPASLYFSYSNNALINK